MLRGDPKDRDGADRWVIAFIAFCGFLLYLAITVTDTDCAGEPGKGFYCNGKTYSTMSEVIEDWED